MLTTATLQYLAIAALMLASVRPFLGPLGQAKWAFWGLLSAVMVTAGAFAISLVLGGWQTDFGTALWATVAASAVVFLAISAVNPAVRGLFALLAPYLTVLGLLGALVRGEPHGLNPGVPAAWIDIHIGLAVAVTGFLTVAAVASTALSLQERALKHKQTRWYQPVLPSVRDAEALSDRLLILVEILLAVGLATGMAVEYFEIGTLLKFDHKTLLSGSAFLLIGALIIGHQVCGVRGRIAARIVLIAYLLIMLASPGVKFITQVLL